MSNPPLCDNCGTEVADPSHYDESQRKDAGVQGKDGVYCSPTCRKEAEENSKELVEEIAEGLVGFEGYREWPGWDNIENIEKAHCVSSGFSNTKASVKKNLRSKRKSLEEKHDLDNRAGIFVCIEEKGSSRDYEIIKAWVMADE